MRTRLMIALGIGCSLKELKKSVYLINESKHESELAKKNNGSTNLLSWQKLFERNLLPFKYSNGLELQPY